MIGIKSDRKIQTYDGAARLEIVKRKQISENKWIQPSTSIERFEPNIYSQNLTNQNENNEYFGVDSSKLTRIVPEVSLCNFSDIMNNFREPC